MYNNKIYNNNNNNEYDNATDTLQVIPHHEAYQKPSQIQITERFIRYDSFRQEKDLAKAQKPRGNIPCT